MEREIIKLTEEELEYFDFTRTHGSWELRDEKYNFVNEIRTDQFSDGESWDTIVQRESDGKFFKWNSWDAGEHNGYFMEHEENSMKEVFPKNVTITTYH
jgi:RAB protein geranylgeranyltransferase component A